MTCFCGKLPKPEGAKTADLGFFDVSLPQTLWPLIAHLCFSCWIAAFEAFNLEDIRPSLEEERCPDPDELGGSDGRLEGPWPGGEDGSDDGGVPFGVVGSCDVGDDFVFDLPRPNLKPEGLGVIADWTSETPVSRSSGFRRVSLGTLPSFFRALSNEADEPERALLLDRSLVISATRSFDLCLSPSCEPVGRAGRSLLCFPIVGARIRATSQRLRSRVVAAATERVYGYVGRRRGPVPEIEVAKGVRRSGDEAGERGRRAAAVEWMTVDRRRGSCGSWREVILAN
ncbi:hypothetical protein ABW21_db0208395 [Orbilia brochopaga]|nr:hypothetical protein ABW21_db0208395 [Drechslerella brochopaga]